MRGGVSLLRCGHMTCGVVLCKVLQASHLEEEEGEEEEEGGVATPQALQFVPLVGNKIRPPDADWSGGWGHRWLFLILIG